MWIEVGMKDQENMEVINKKTYKIGKKILNIKEKNIYIKSIKLGL